MYCAVARISSRYVLSKAACRYTDWRHCRKAPRMQGVNGLSWPVIPHVWKTASDACLMMR